MQCHFPEFSNDHCKSDIARIFLALNEEWVCPHKPRLPPARFLGARCWVTRHSHILLRVIISSCRVSCIECPITSFCSSSISLLILNDEDDCTIGTSTVSSRNLPCEFVSIFQDYLSISISMKGKKATSSESVPALPTISALHHLEPRPGGQWAVTEQSNDSYSLAYLMDDGHNSICYTIHPCTTEEEIRNRCGSLIYDGKLSGSG